MSKYKCIIFDCDGVLIDSETIAIGTLVEMANDLGAKMDLEESIINLKGKSLNLCIGIVSNLIDVPLPETFEADYRINTFRAFKEQIQPIRVTQEQLPRTLTWM